MTKWTDQTEVITDDIGMISFSLACQDLCFRLGQHTEKVEALGRDITGILQNLENGEKKLREMELKADTREPAAAEVK